MPAPFLFQPLIIEMMKTLRFLPPAITLITSRISLDSATEIPVDQLDDADALDVLRERLGWTDAIAQAEKADALTLIRRLGGHALALVITAQRMAKSTPHIMTCASALRDLQAAPSLVKALKLPERNDPEGNVAVSFALSYAQLNQEQKSTFLALGLCASSWRARPGYCAHDRSR